MATPSSSSSEPVRLATDDPTQELRAKIAELGLVGAEGAIDRAGLLAALGLDEAGEPDRYAFGWAGMADAIKVTREPALQALALDREASVEVEKTANTMVAGDNLEVLKLLAPAYRGRVKCIYIDPPYNTGTDKVYRDNFHDPLGAYLKQTGQVDANGDALSTNPEVSGRFHGTWLTMMFPRLWWGRQMLSEDGVFFCSIDDHEQHHLRLLLDQIFGFENFIASFVWIKKKKGSHLSRSHRSMTEYVLAYAKNKDRVGELFGEEAYKKKAQPLLNRPNKPRTLVFEPGIVSTPLPDGHYPAATHGSDDELAVEFSTFQVEEGFVVTPLTVTGRFRWQQEFLDKEIDNGSQVTLSKKFGFNTYRYDEEGKFKRPTTLLGPEAGVGSNEDAFAELDSLLGGKGLIDYPKPVSLVKYLVRSATYFHPDALVMDFFAGSGTTGQAVMEVNAELGGQRRFLLVQLPEETDAKSAAHKAGYTDLAQLCAERLRRAGAQAEGDTGFRLFRQKNSSFAAAAEAAKNAPQTTEELMAQLQVAVDPLSDGWSEGDVLWEVAEKHGWPLDAELSTFKLDGASFFQLQAGAEGEKANKVLVCSLEDDLSKKASSALLNREPAVDLFVCRDTALSDTQTANLSLQLQVRTI